MYALVCEFYEFNSAQYEPPIAKGSSDYPCVPGCGRALRCALRLRCHGIFQTQLGRGRFAK